MSVQLEKNREDVMYVCKCCKSFHCIEEDPPIAGMCSECYKSKEKALIALNNIERELSHMISVKSSIDLIKIRDNLRTTMRTMGWQGH